MGAEVGLLLHFSLSTGVWRLIYELPEEIVLSIWPSLWKADLRADEVVTDEPLKYYDRVIEIDLSNLNLILMDLSRRMRLLLFRGLRKKVLLNGYPRKMEVGRS